MGNVLNNRYRAPAFTGALTLITTGSQLLVCWNLCGYAVNAYLQLFNSATVAGVTLGSTAPVVTLFVPANGTSFFSNEGDAQWQFPDGIVAASVTTLGDASSTITPIYLDIQWTENTN